MNSIKVIWWLFALYFACTTLHFPICYSQSKDLREKNFPYLLKPVTPSHPYNTSQQKYLFVDLNDDGKFLSKIPTGSIGSITEVFVQDLNLDDTSEIIVTNSERSQKESSFVAFLDLSSKQLIKRRTRYERLVPDVGFLDWQEDGKIEFLTLWANGLLEIRDDKNNVVKSMDTQLQDCRNLRVFDIEQDGTEEIAIWGASGILLLNN